MTEDLRKKYDYFKTVITLITYFKTVETLSVNSNGKREQKIAYIISRLLPVGLGRDNRRPFATNIAYL